MTDEIPASPADSTNPSPAPPVSGSPDLSATIQAASRAAVNDHVQERTGAKRGPKGPWKYKENIPINFVANNPSAALLGKTPTKILPPDVQPLAAPDSESLRVFVEGVTDLLDDIGRGVARGIIGRCGGDKQCRDDMAAECAMSEKTRKAIVTSGHMLAKQYAQNLRHAPVVMLSLAVITHVGGTANSIRAGVDKLKEFQPKN